MGIEYAIILDHGGDRQPLNSLLTKLGGSRVDGPSGSSFEFGAATPAVGMPDASAMIIEKGLYFCDYGGRGKEVLGRIVSALVGEFGAVRVREYEP